MKLTAADWLLEFRSLELGIVALAFAHASLAGGRDHPARRLPVLAPCFFGWLRDFSPRWRSECRPSSTCCWSTTAPAEDVSATRSLRFMSSSTAPLMVEQHKRFEETYGVELVQLYGMSEGGIVASNHVGARRIGSVGRPGLYQNCVDRHSDERPPDGDNGNTEIGERSRSAAHSPRPVDSASRWLLGADRTTEDWRSRLSRPRRLLIVTGARDDKFARRLNIAPLRSTTHSPRIRTFSKRRPSACPTGSMARSRSHSSLSKRAVRPTTERFSITARRHRRTSSAQKRIVVLGRYSEE